MVVLQIEYFPPFLYLQTLFFMIKNLTKYSIFIMLLAFTSCSSCKKDSILPSATQSGANTFGCKVNGEIWIPDGRGGINGVKAIDNVFTGVGSDPKVYLWLTTYKSDGSTLHLYLKDPYNVGTYYLNKNTGIRPNIIFPDDYGFFSKGRYYITDSLHLGKITIIKSDIYNGLIAGTFEYTASNPITKETVTVTEGRFDIDVKTLNK